MRARQKVMVKGSPLILRFIYRLDLFPFTIPEGSRQIGKNIYFLHTGHALLKIYIQVYKDVQKLYNYSAIFMIQSHFNRGN